MDHASRSVCLPYFLFTPPCPTISSYSCHLDKFLPSPLHSMGLLSLSCPLRSPRYFFILGGRIKQMILRLSNCIFITPNIMPTIFPIKITHTTPAKYGTYIGFNWRDSVKHTSPEHFSVLITPHINLTAKGDHFPLPIGYLPSPKGVRILYVNPFPLPPHM